MSLKTERESEIDLKFVVLRLLRGWRIITLTTVLALIVGVALYFLVPRSYQSVAKILPISQSAYAQYAELIAKTAIPGDPQGDDARHQIFPYTRDDLLNEFVTYLQSPAHLIRAAQESGVLRDKDGKSSGGESAALAFARSVTFSSPTDRKPGFEMRVRSGNEDALNKFVAWSLDNAKVEAAKLVRASVIDKIEAGEKMRKDSIASLKVDIASRRLQAENIRKDNIEQLTEQARIAATLNIVDPVSVQALSPKQENATAASAQVIGGDQPTYFQGSAALEEQISLLKNRKDNDPYTNGLRDLQRQLYALENDDRAQTLRALLDGSALGKPASAPLASYSIIAATAQRTFPRSSIFGVGSLLIGFIIGAGIVLLRTERGEVARAKTPTADA